MLDTMRIKVRSCTDTAIGKVSFLMNMKAMFTRRQTTNFICDVALFATVLKCHQSWHDLLTFSDSITRLPVRSHQTSSLQLWRFWPLAPVILHVGQQSKWRKHIKRIISVTLETWDVHSVTLTYAPEEITPTPISAFLNDIIVKKNLKSVFQVQALAVDCNQCC